MATNPVRDEEKAGSTIGRRAHARARVALPGVVETLDGRRSVSVKNLSSAGAMVEAQDRTPPVGKDLVLQCFGLDALGVVVWESGARCGIEFYDRIEQKEVIEKRQLSDDEMARHRWRTRQELLEAAERWARGKNS